MTANYLSVRGTAFMKENTWAGQLLRSSGQGRMPSRKPSQSRLEPDAGDQVRIRAGWELASAACPMLTPRLSSLPPPALTSSETAQA
ncbi:hypothetical protein CC1G_12251 [Coprinopsis cinerea okayama7|uniref:Uncharacterized protein n=1 Tax=Coprinopsis cinerea (strain Okayama-7 / 130 / ATCC MYA-4618 / FGSC 9003) TaxID=240176 RepID=A8P768_COPC7|nr:hypothetical protein CC1G_12251 [Coprinopsis cinerea okayama7\|eukprot:XP_001839303.1 hypothetical protein CC1G_12251 [Coprinopsis cinerea okayama7\